MALHSLYCADVPLRNCSLTHVSSPHPTQQVISETSLSRQSLALVLTTQNKQPTKMQKATVSPKRQIWTQNMAMCLSNFFVLNMLNWYCMTKRQTFNIPQYLVIFHCVRGELHAVLTPYFTQCTHHRNRRKFLCLQNRCVECTSVGSISANASNSSPVSVDKELST